jgi:hypothetical protein
VYISATAVPGTTGGTAGSGTGAALAARTTAVPDLPAQGGGL